MLYLHNDIFLTEIMTGYNLVKFIPQNEILGTPLHNVKVQVQVKVGVTLMA